MQSTLARLLVLLPSLRQTDSNGNEARIITHVSTCIRSLKALSLKSSRQESDEDAYEEGTGTLVKCCSLRASASNTNIMSIPEGRVGKTVRAPGKQRQILGSYLESSRKFSELYEDCSQHGSMGFNLPPVGALVRRVLRHAIHRLEVFSTSLEA